MNRYQLNLLRESATPVLNYLFPRAGEEVAHPTQEAWQKYFRYLEYKFIDTSFAELSKDFADTAKPYKNIYTFLRDFIGDIAYFLRGIYNLVIGVGMLMLTPINAYLAYRNAGYSLFGAVGSAVGMGLATLITGFTQMLYASVIPLRIPLRGLITLSRWGSHDGAPVLEDSQTIRKIVDEYDRGRLTSINSGERFNAAYKTLLDKATKARARFTPVETKRHPGQAAFSEFCSNEAELDHILKTASSEDVRGSLFAFFSRQVDIRRHETDAMPIIPVRPAQG